MRTSRKYKTVLTALAATVGSAAMVITATVPADAAHLPFRVYAPWDSGLTNRVGGNLPNYYGEGGHTLANGDYWAVDINGLNGGNSDCDTRVRATSPGTVIRSSWNGGYGIQVVLKHGSTGVTSSYSHLSSTMGRVAVNTVVRQGQVLGYMGNTGNSSYCHLHFEIEKNGASTPPSAMSGVSLPDTHYGDTTGYLVKSDNVLR